MSDPNVLVNCPTCEGRGWVLIELNIHDWHDSYSARCTHCAGKGTVSYLEFVAITGVV